MDSLKKEILEKVKESKMVWEYFYDISQIPHGSFNLNGISDFIRKEALSLNLSYKEDKEGNICVSVPARGSFEGKETDIIIFQSHTDMVCEKNSDKDHDFEKDPIEWDIKGNRLYAKGTTLGADNGIGVAMMLALMKDKSLSHPALECLFTTDEEVGLIGATNLDISLIKGQFLINLDNEDEGVFCIGCAGGINSLITKNDFEWISQKEGILSTLEIKGLSGGHSGQEIHKDLGNANILMARFLKELVQENKEISLVSWEGGNKSNAIPREAKVVLWGEDPLDLGEGIKVWEKTFKKELKEGQDQSFSFTLTETPLSGEVKSLSHSLTKDLINVLALVPHGVKRMFSDDLVGTSLNFASVHISSQKEACIVLSHRSLWEEEMQPDKNMPELQKEFKKLGFQWGYNEGYLPWEPKKDSYIASFISEVYESKFKEKPALAVIHAGLECGVIGSQKEELDMIAFGPNIRAPHTPEEYVEINSVENTWIFIKELLSSWRK